MMFYQYFINSLNKKFKDTKVELFLDGSDSTPTDIKEFVSTGSSMLDLLYLIVQMRNGRITKSMD